MERRRETRGSEVGANTSMFTVIDRALWTDLPVPEGDELVRLRKIRDTAGTLTRLFYGGR